MRIWHYDREMGFLIGEGTAEPCPVKPGDWLIPAWATSVAPPAVSASQIAVFNGASWHVVPRADLAPAVVVNPADRI